MPVTQSISSAAAYLDMSEAEFRQRFILTGRVTPDRLHQVPVDRITRFAESLGLRWLTWEQVWNQPKRYPYVKLHPKAIPLHRR